MKKAICILIVTVLIAACSLPVFAAANDMAPTGAVSGALAEYTVTVGDKSTVATTSGATSWPMQTFYFFSASGQKLGSISGDTYNKVAKQYQVKDAEGFWGAPSKDGQWETWFAEQFNLYRGLGGIASNSTADTNTIKSEDSGVSLATLINDWRIKNGLDELVYDLDINELANLRAQEIAESFGHIRLDGSSVTDLGFAEIITVGANASKAFTNFAESKEHNRIMLRERYNRYAVGCYVADNNKTYWVVLLSK